MASEKVQLNVRIHRDTAKLLDEVVDYYQEHTKYGKVYKGEVLTDIIEKSHEIMQKQKQRKKQPY
ncbi:hypothetical protein SAMN05192534_101383 [Alteribacillus persepolensis]|uniref:Uncharacterized protein n=1 Tax=Alteribacillus persepolensis TaxID=568899 RepID=A0A1G7Z329_9BACI|nr:hypothetical protein [Alteribacillus persepolensis]SDH03138.1 hypothetical protein SAMN05192534_101383 [Alteribacillus persepolensis]